MVEEDATYEGIKKFLKVILVVMSLVICIPIKAEEAPVVKENSNT